MFSVWWDFELVRGVGDAEQVGCAEACVCLCPYEASPGRGLCALFLLKTL